MAEYIEREALNKIIDREIDVCNSGMIRGELEYLKAIVSIAADVVEVKRGEWMFDEAEMERYCSLCGRNAPIGVSSYILCNFCPNCGADMRSEGNNENQ